MKEILYMAPKRALKKKITSIQINSSCHLLSEVKTNQVIPFSMHLNVLSQMTCTYPPNVVRKLKNTSPLPLFWLQLILLLLFINANAPPLPLIFLLFMIQLKSWRPCHLEQQDLQKYGLKDRCTDLGWEANAGCSLTAS